MSEEKPGGLRPPPMPRRKPRRTIQRLPLVKPETSGASAGTDSDVIKPSKSSNPENPATTSSTTGVDQSGGYSKTVTLAVVQHSSARNSAAASGASGAAGTAEAKSRKLGAGFMGSIFYPPLPCQNAELEKQLEQVSKRTPLVLKYTELAMGMTAVQTANFVRDRWDKIRRSAALNCKSMPASVWNLMNEIRTRTPEDFFVLPLSQVCSNCLAPDRSKTLNDSGTMVGIYMPHAGRKWSEVLPPGSPLTRREIPLIRHVIAAILLLHSLGITHNDIRRANITIDALRVPRLIDWELRSRPQDENTNTDTLYVDQLPDDRRWWQCWVHGFFATPRDLVRLDWLGLARVLSRTWEPVATADGPDSPNQTVSKYQKLLTQVLKLLNAASDRDALLAWTLLLHHT